MNFQEAQAIMIDGDETQMDGTRYRIKNYRLQYFANSKWHLNMCTFSDLNHREWHNVPAKEYTFIEAARLCFLCTSFSRVNFEGTVVTLSYSDLDGLNCRSPCGQITIEKPDIDAMWTEVVR